MTRFAFAVFLILSGPHLSAADAGPKLQAETAGTIVRAQEQMDAKQYKAAEATLDARKKSLKARAYDRAYLLSIYGYLYLAQERYDAALKAFTEADEAGQLSGETRRNILYNIAQLQVIQHRYGEAETRLLQWLESAEKVRSEDYMLLADIRIQLQHFGEAAAAVRQAMAAAPEPNRVHYQTLYYLQYEQHRLAEAAATLKKMIGLFAPVKSDYLQLSGLLLQQADSEGALAVLELARLQGLLETKEELMQLAQLYLYRGIPLRAAELLETEARAERYAPDAAWYALEAQAWQRAREDDRALRAYARAAARGDGEAYVAMAYLYAGRHDPDGVIDAAEKALAAGVRESNALRLLEGQALFEKGEYLLAEKVFDTVPSGGKAGRQARQWLDYIAGRKIQPSK